MAAAQDRLFPALFGRVSSRGVPAIGIIFSAILATSLILVQAAGSSGFAAFYSLVVNLATMTAVVPYAFCALSVGLVAAHAAGGGKVPSVGVVEWIAFIFSIFTLYGCGPEPVLYGFVLLMLGIPVYVWQVRQQSAVASRHDVAARTIGDVAQWNARVRHELATRRLDRASVCRTGDFPRPGARGDNDAARAEPLSGIGDDLTRIAVRLKRLNGGLTALNRFALSAQSLERRDERDVVDRTVVGVEHRAERVGEGGLETM